MLLKVYSVHDIKVGAYLPPIYFRSKGEAIRAFSAAAMQTDHDFHKYASDYTLFEIGSWDDANAKFESHLTPIPVGKALDFLSEPKQPLVLAS
ncbi:MAG: nonstructural protein [Microvirus sp.]|nr:MAG: nonstructural protein [Microvirus sp.]